MKIPRYPKGLKRRLAKARRKKELERKRAERIKEIASMRSELKKLTR